jgi:hypothetical protein
MIRIAAFIIYKMNGGIALSYAGEFMPKANFHASPSLT